MIEAPTTNGPVQTDDGEARLAERVARATALRDNPQNLQRESFSLLVRSFRERDGRSRNALAHACGVDPSYLTRIESDDRNPGRVLVEALARAMRLNLQEEGRLLVAAGWAPRSLTDLGTWPPALQAVLDVLNDSYLTMGEKQEFCDVLRLIASKWL